MNFKLQYRIDIGFNQNEPIPYSEPQRAIRRLQSICRTSRRNIVFPWAQNLWEEFFNNLWNDRQNIPEQQEEFDNWHKDRVNVLASLLQIGNNWPLGLAQKMLNLFLKDLWAWDEINNNQALNLHAPLDRIILSHIKNIPESWKNWTKVFCNEHDFENKYSEYLRIQSILRNYWRNINRFSSLIEMEQFLWHKIEQNYGSR